MSDTSILDQIINTQKAEEIAKLNAVEIVNNIFNELSERERDILIRRFGLHGKGCETLENVGKIHGLTRERIRQIESSSIKKLAQLDKLERYIENLKKIIQQLLEEHGGLMEREYLLDALVSFSMDGDNFSGKEKEEIISIHKNHLDFLISKLLHQEFEKLNNSKKFKKSFKLKYQTLEHLEELAEELLAEIKKAQKIFKTEEIIEMFTQTESYKKHKEKININSNIDISNILNNEFFEEDAELINNNKALYSLLKALEEIEQNKFGYWGVHNSREIKPKTINDKIFLVLKENGKPMHFSEIADRINEIGFDKKKANAATVHNELILDSKYVLIGRGIYGLREWGYKQGTVTDVIGEILKQAGKPLTKDEIIEKVLEKRIVKKTTINLALMNKDLFEKKGNKYSLKASNNEEEKQD